MVDIKNIKDIKEIDIHDMSIDILKKVKLDDIHAFLFYLKNILYYYVATPFNNPTSNIFLYILSG